MMSQFSDESSITAEWLDGILQTYFTYKGPKLEGDNQDRDGAKDDEHVAPTIQVVDFQIQPGCSEGENLLSELLAIDVTFRRDGGDQESLHLMAKLLSQDPFCRHFIIEAGFDAREIHFYTTLIPTVSQFCNSQFAWPIPACYYAKYRQGTDSILVLQNLKHDDYQVKDFCTGLSLEEACAAVESIADIHAATLTYRIKENIDLVEAFPFLFHPEAAAQSYQQLLERGLPQLSSFLHTSEDPQLHAVLAKLHKLRPKAQDIITDLLRPTSPISTLTHTDFWCNNLMFRNASPTQCSILDWQMATFSRPTNDIALLLVTSVSGEIRRTQTQHILDVYWDQLTNHASRLGLDIEAQLNYTKVDLLQEYQQSLLLAMLLGIGSVDIAIGQKETEDRLCQVLVDLSQDKVF